MIDLVHVKQGQSNSYRETPRITDTVLPEFRQRENIGALFPARQDLRMRKSIPVLIRGTAPGSLLARLSDGVCVPRVWTLCVVNNLARRL